MSETYVCNTCHEEKSKKAFPRSEKNSRGIEARCKACNNRVRRETRIRKPRPTVWLYRPMGEQNPNAKYAEADIKLIKQCYAARMKISLIAEKFEMPRSTVSDICNGRKWAHV